MRAALLAITALASTAFSSPLPLPSAKLDLPRPAPIPALARRDFDHLSPADVSHFGAVLALQLLGRGALHSTASTGGECAAECGGWLDALSTCPSGPGNDTLAFSGAVSTAVHLVASPFSTSSFSSAAAPSATAAPSSIASTLEWDNPQPTTTTTATATNSAAGQAPGGQAALYVVFAAVAIFFGF
ncbi:hypothetical protein JCM8097_004688 [Rhodosporidiobolus ruineniae]